MAKVAYIWQNLQTIGSNCLQMATFKYTWQPTCLQMAAAMSYSLAHLAVPYGGRQDPRLEPKYIQMAAAIAYNAMAKNSHQRQQLIVKGRSCIPTLQQVHTHGNPCLQMATFAYKWQQ
jgi:hypothetical protein